MTHLSSAVCSVQGVAQVKVKLALLRAFLARIDATPQEVGTPRPIALSLHDEAEVSEREAVVRLHLESLQWSETE